MATAASAAADTFPRLLLEHAKWNARHPALREKDLGIWQVYSWAQTAEQVKKLAAGLHVQGFRRGQHLAIIGENRPRLYFAMMAAQCLGGIPVPMYQDAVAAEMVYVFHNAEIQYAIVEDQEQVDKLLEIRGEHPQLEHIYFDDPRGLRHYSNPGVLPLDELVRLGEGLLSVQPRFIDEEVAKGSTQDTAALFYTSGTTGKPKGVVLTHAALIASANAYIDLDKLSRYEDVLAYLPMAWIGQNLFSYAQALVAGFTVNCPESPSTVAADMREIGPTYYFAPPRVFEGLLTQVMIRMEDAGWIKRSGFHYFMEVAKRVGGRILDGQPVSVLDRALYAIGDVCVYGPLRNVLGMTRVRVAYTAGEAIGPDLFSFYRSIGINLKQLYGSTETSVYVCVQPDGHVRADTVGPPLPGVQVRIRDNGEIMLKTPGLLKEYYKNAEATAEVLDAEGWYHTGDAGYLDADGHLKIIDRANDVGKLVDGTLFAPKYIENKLKFFPYIKEAVAFGNQRDEVCAFINIDFEAVGNWAERRGLPYAGYIDLAGKPEVLALIAECVEKVNADLAADVKLGNSQAHRFLILHKELDPDDDELTRTRKVRRRFIEDKYKVLVDALYSGKREQFIETQVKFEDGRTGTISATLPIRDVKTFPPMQAAA